MTRKKARASDSACSWLIKGSMSVACHEEVARRLRTCSIGRCRSKRASNCIKSDQGIPSGLEAARTKSTVYDHDRMFCAEKRTITQSFSPSAHRVVGRGHSARKIKCGRGIKSFRLLGAGVGIGAGGTCITNWARVMHALCGCCCAENPRKTIHQLEFTTNGPLFE